eukprot:7756216-Pyramimonas_sp.AAC.1
MPVQAQGSVYPANSCRDDASIGIWHRVDRSTFNDRGLPTLARLSDSVDRPMSADSGQRRRSTLNARAKVTAAPMRHEPTVRPLLTWPGRYTDRA